MPAFNVVPKHINFSLSYSPCLSKYENLQKSRKTIHKAKNIAVNSQNDKATATTGKQYVQVGNL